MIAIYKRELKAFFQSMIGWLFVAAVMFITGLFFMSVNLIYGYPSIAGTLSNASFIYIITIPILTMRIISEERKQKTDQLTLTAPVSLLKIVAGKYLAMSTVLLIPILVICIYPLILMPYGTIAIGETYVAILGFLLYGLAAVALGLFVSSMTESQVIAAVISFAALFITYMMKGICSLITSSGNSVTAFIAKILDAFDICSRFDSLLNGNLDLRAILYFLTFILVCLFLTTQSIQKRRYSISVKNIKIGAYSTGLIVVVLAAAVFANLLFSEIPESYTKFDVTNEKLYTLTNTTKDYIKNLTEDINIYVLQDEKQKDEVLDSTLKKYEELSKHIKVSYNNPVKNPSFYKQYTDGNISLNSVIVESSKRYKVIDFNDIYESTVDYSTYQETTTGYDGEGQITSAIDYVTKDEMPKAYVIEGHDETALDPGFQSVITKQNITMENINLMNVDSIPQDAAFVMIMAPRSDFSADDSQKIIDYAKNGGKLLITTMLIENYAETMPNFNKILECYNTSIVNGMIVEADSNYYYQQPTYLLPNVAESYLTSGVSGTKYVFMPYAQGIHVDEADDVTLNSMMTTTEGSYSKIDLDNATTYEKSENDINGPFDVGVYVKKTYGDKDASLFLFSSFNFFTDQADQMVSGANATIFSNCVKEFCGQGEESSIVVPVKEYQMNNLVINSGSALLLGILVAIIVPIVLIAVGITIWLKRRKR